MTDKSEKTDENEKGFFDKLTDGFTEWVDRGIYGARALYYLAKGYSFGEDIKQKSQYGYTKKEIDTALFHDFNYKDNSPKNLEKFKKLIEIACKIDSKYLEKNVARLALKAQTK